MRGRKSKETVGPVGEFHIRLNGTVSELRGWGRAGAPNWSVRVELRDHGMLAISRGPERRATDVIAIPITQLELGLTTRRRSKGGGYVGGGIGLRGALIGMAAASALNSMTYAEWEETRLRITEIQPTGAVREVFVRVHAATPTDLLDALWPAVDNWSDEWVSAVFRGETEAFIDARDIGMTLNEIAVMRTRMVLRPDQALKVAGHVTRPYLDAIRERALAARVDRDEADEILAWLDAQIKRQLIARRDVGPLRRLLAKVPAPEDAADRAAEHARLLAHLEALRETGAISADDLAAERRRLLGA